MANPGTRRIDHVVVLMLENRSFDHLLGFLDHPKPEAFDGLRGRDDVFNLDESGTPIHASLNGVPVGMRPDHSHAGAMLQMSHFPGVGDNAGFVKNYFQVTKSVAESARVMECLDPDVHSPVLATLAREFAVCTRWFSSVPGQTWPNRNYAHAGTSDDSVNIERGLFRDPTIFELLENADQDWSIYYDGTPQVWCFSRLWKPSLFWNFLLRRPPRVGRWFESGSFESHVQDGKLAAYSFIEPAHNRFYSPQGQPRRTNSQHPENNEENDDDFQAGEALIRQVYESLRQCPEVFERTLMLVTYDEHGGLYDHVPPPATFPPGDPIQRGLARKFDLWRRRRRSADPGPPWDWSRLGFRVPAVLVSPWIQPATVCSEEFEHSSIPATLRQLFAPSAAPLTRRDEAANSFQHLVHDSPRSTARRSPGPPGDDGGDHPLPVFPLAPVALTGADQEEDTHRSRLDEELDDLAKLVRRSLRTSLAARLLRSRAPAGSRAEAAPRGADPASVFSATAEGARSR